MSLNITDKLLDKIQEIDNKETLEKLISIMMQKNTNSEYIRTAMNKLYTLGDNS